MFVILIYDIDDNNGRSDKKLKHIKEECAQ